MVSVATISTKTYGVNLTYEAVMKSLIDSFANILAEARKYKLSLILAHQYMEQMPDAIRAAVFGNIGTMVWIKEFFFKYRKN